jgi:CDP-paratose 2-epimerase
MIARTGAISTGAISSGAPSAEESQRDKVRARRPIVLVTGGAGFIGTNLCLELLDLGCAVRVLDNLSRPGVLANACHLRERGGARLQLLQGDVRRPADVEPAIDAVDGVFHLAAQVAVTTSLMDPTADFEVNARGTLNVLEALRRAGRRVPLLYTSTNKVYGGIEGLRVLRRGRRDQPRDNTLARTGVDERTVEFRTPYGCSKGAAEQYVLDYARCFGLPATVFRMSSIFGPHQRGSADQGWVAHFLTRVLSGEPIEIFGDGCQVRDVLCVDDLVRAFVSFLAEPELLAGRAFNVGGGCTNAVSLLELLDLLGSLTGTRPRLSFSTWRPGDQRWYVSDTRRLYQALGWKPEVPVLEGLVRLHRWLLSERGPRALVSRAAEGPSRSWAC